MKSFVWLLVLVLLVMHQGYYYWHWDNATLVFGFLPYSLAFHCVLSVFATVVWVLATRFCWPTDYIRRFEMPADGTKGEQS